MFLLWFCGKNTNDTITILEMAENSSTSFTLMSQFAFYKGVRFRETLHFAVNA